MHAVYSTADVCVTRQQDFKRPLEDYTIHISLEGKVASVEGWVHNCLQVYLSMATELYHGSL